MQNPSAYDLERQFKEKQMGRPLNKKYFGNTNTPAIGGEGVASIAVSGTNTGYTAVPDLVVGAPNLPTGVQAVARAHMEVSTVVNFLAGTGYSVNDVLTLTEPGDVAVTRATLTVNTVDTGGEILTVTITTRGDYTTLPADVSRYSVTGGTGNGADFNLTFRVKSAEVTTTGSGYTSAPSVTDSGNADFTATLTSVKTNAISMTGYLTGGSAVAVDIIRQVSTRRYKVTDGTRTGIVTLQDSLANAAGEGSIVATDASGGTYYVTKLTAHKATLKRGTGTVYADGAAVPWTFGTATATVCKIANA